MKQLVSASLVLLPLLALASEDTLQHATTSCLSVVGWGTDVAQAFKGRDIMEGGGPGEYEVISGDTHIFVDLDGNGCGLMDPTVSPERAEVLLSEILRSQRIKNVRVEEGWGGQPVTRGEGPRYKIEVYVNADGSGSGYAISLQPKE